MDDNCIYCGGEYRNSVMYQEMGSDDTKGHVIEWNYCPVCDEWVLKVLPITPKEGA